jgi:hypothetical protein
VALRQLLDNRADAKLKEQVSFSQLITHFCLARWSSHGSQPAGQKADEQGPDTAKPPTQQHNSTCVTGL